MIDSDKSEFDVRKALVEAQTLFDSLMQQNFERGKTDGIH